MSQRRAVTEPAAVCIGGEHLQRTDKQNKFHLFSGIEVKVLSILQP